MPTFQIDLRSPDGIGLVLYVEAANLQQAKRTVKNLPEDPNVHLRLDDHTEAHLYLYGHQLANHLAPWDDD